MVRPRKPIDLLRVHITVKLEPDNAAWLIRKGTDLTQGVEDALNHLRSCPRAFDVELPTRQDPGRKQAFRLDPGHVAWMTDQIARRRFKSYPDALDYAIAHARTCPARPRAAQRVKTRV